jgi:adenylate cyclase
MGRVLIIAACWTAGLLFSYVDTYLLIGDLVRLGKLQGSYAFLPDFTGTLVVGLLGGLLGGYLLVYEVNSGRRHKSFMSDIVRSAALFVLIFVATAVTLLFMMAFVYNVLRTDVAAAARAGWTNVLVNLGGPSFVASIVVWGLLVAGTQFMLQVNDKFGPGVLWKLMTGRYYQPREEERIFMFLDLKSSTSIAETLGHRRFFELLRELYQDITWPVHESGGEIYQYVGDEVVISWSPRRGLQNEDCIRCFFRIGEALDARRSDYLRRFEVAPTFKAGLHMGPITVGEIGIVKKDIVFSGDVLNTTSRIQGECNRYRIDLLASSDLLERLPPTDAFHAQPIGEIRLRGKAKPLALSVVVPA